MNRFFFFRLLFLLFALEGFAMAQDDGPNELKQRMAKRLPAVDTLKTAEKVGENNLGYLFVRVKELAATESALVEAENKDRKAVYEYIARKTGEKPVVVGQKRAADLRQASKKAVWLQDPKGSWYRKS